jgi:chromosome segregation ATPase
MAKGANGGGWSTGKILAVVIPICVVVAAVTITLVLVLGGSDSSHEEILETYQKIDQEAQEALKEVEQAQAAPTTSETYQEDLQLAYDEVEALLTEMGEAITAVEEAATSVDETAQQYMELYQEIESYYAYLEGLVNEALSQIEYLQSIAPALEDLEEFTTLVQRIENAPAILQKRELSSRLNGEAQAMLGDLQGKTAPESLSGFSQDMQSLADSVDSTARQMTQTLQSGNGETFSAQASQLNSSISQVQQQLTADLSAAISNMSTGLSQKAQSVDSLMPQ